MGGTWRTAGAVECNSGRAPAGGEAEGSLTAHGPDRDKLGLLRHHELGIGPGGHLHLGNRASC